MSNIKTPNEIKIIGEACLMDLYNRKKEIVGQTVFDTKNLKHISKYKWHLLYVGYAATRINRKYVYLHKFIKGNNNNLIVDHINHNRLDNREINLRFVNASQSVWNTKSKGYCYNKNAKKWMVEIMVNYRKHYLGCFKTEGEAIKVRREAEQKYFGEYAYKEAA
jgi:hypothetical protein